MSSLGLRTSCQLTTRVQSVDNFMVRKGSRSNVMVFDDAVYNASLFTASGDNYVFNHNAYGADMFRYSWNFGVNWTTWGNWQDSTTIPKSNFTGNFWSGAHVMVQCESFHAFATSAAG
jgi:alpha-1,3-glucan synthase